MVQQNLWPTFFPYAHSVGLTRGWRSSAESVSRINSDGSWARTQAPHVIRFLKRPQVQWVVSHKHRAQVHSTNVVIVLGQLPRIRFHATISDSRSYWSLRARQYS